MGLFATSCWYFQICFILRREWLVLLKKTPYLFCFGKRKICELCQQPAYRRRAHYVFLKKWRSRYSPVAGRFLIDFMYTVSEHAIGIIPKEIGWRNRGRVPGCLLETRQKKDEHSNVECGTHDVMSHMMRLCVVLRVIMADRWWHAWKGL